MAGLLEEQRGAAGAQHAVGDLRHFEPCGHGRGDALEFALALKLGQKISEVAVLHYRSRQVGYIFDAFTG